jgi:hypothetical protein
MKITVDIEQKNTFPALYASKDSCSGGIPKVIILVEQEYEGHYVGTVVDTYDNETFYMATRLAVPKHRYVRFNGTVSIQND